MVGVPSLCLVVNDQPLDSFVAARLFQSLDSFSFDLISCEKSFASLRFILLARCRDLTKQSDCQQMMKSLPFAERNATSVNTATPLRTPLEIMPLLSSSVQVGNLV